MIRNWVFAVATGSALVAAGLSSKVSILRWADAPLPAQAAPVADVDVYNSRFPIERGECLAVSLGSNAAAECGDLRVEHALPSVRVFNSTVTPTLLYNSDFAHPYPVTTLAVKQLSTTTTPDSVEVELWVGPLGGTRTLRTTKRWAGNEWPSGQTTTRRIALVYDAINDTTGIYSVEVRVANLYPGGVRFSQTPFMPSAWVVNRSISPYGAGWWPVGLEQVKKTYSYPGNPDQYMWIGGDGSTRIFIQGYANAYDRLDSLQVIPGSMFVRRLPEGRRVEFDWSGRHVRTINRFGRTGESQS